MRLKSYTAPSMAEAMYLVRQELGDNAIIVSTQRAAGGKGIRITAALEPADVDDAIGEMLAEIGRSPAADTVRRALVEHGVPGRLADRLVNAIHAHGESDPLKACAAALTAGFAFAPLPEHAAPRPFMLVGPPGTGKSTAVAKLAARSVLKHHSVGVISCDNLRAGAADQLQVFTRILAVELATARGPDSLARAAQDAQESSDIVFIDSPGLNPFKLPDMEYLAALIEAANVEPILVLAAGGDPTEAAEIAEAFCEAGATRLLATRLDTSRRLGSIMASADAGPLLLAGVSATPHIVNGINSISAENMAQMILPRAQSTQTADLAAEADQ